MLDGVDYPIVRVEATPGLDLMFGSTKVGYYTDMAAKPLGWHYERIWPGQSVGQFQAVWDSDCGTYVGVEDAQGHVKQLVGDRVKRGVELFPRALVAVTNRYVQSYDVVVRRVRRTPGGEPLDWHDFAEIYRTWDVRQPWSRTLYRDLESDCDRFAPLYAYLYHDRMPVFQSNPYRDDPFSIAFQAVSGQMPFYRPDFAELDESRPALANGGFENLVDSVRGPADWDRLIPAKMLKGTDRKTPLWNFRGGANNMGWLGYGVTLDDKDRHSGRVSLKFDPPKEDGRDNGEPMQVSQTVVGLEPGEYVFSAWVKSDAAAAPAGSILLGTRGRRIGLDRHSAGCGRQDAHRVSREARQRAARHRLGSGRLPLSRRRPASREGRTRSAGLG